MGAARVAALTLIALVAFGLGYLHFAHDESISVPPGARAGQLTLDECSYSTEDGDYDADCGTLVVPENRHEADSRLIALPVKRIRARSANPEPPIFRLQGGPGISNMSFPAASRFADKRDVVLIGYRGVDGSSRLDCPEVTSARAHAREFLTEEAFHDDARAFRDCARRLRDEGVDLAGYTLPQRVDDLDAARRALGYDRIDLVSESAGTRTAMIYAWRYQERVRRSVMIGVNPPGRFLWDAKTTGEQVRRYAALCAHDSSCSRRTNDLAASLHAAHEDLPERWWFLPIRQGNVRAATFFGLMHTTTDAAGPLAGPWTIDAQLKAANGDGSGAWLQSLLAQLIFPRAQVWGDVAAVARADATHARRFFAEDAGRGSVLDSAGTDLIWAGGALLDSWPANADENRYTRVQDSDVETLLIGGDLDFATPPQNAHRELLPHLPNGREVVLKHLGHSDDFWTYQPDAGTRLIDGFLDRGRVDTSLYRGHRVDFMPTLGLGWIATIVAGVMVGLAALTVLTLAWLALRVSRRARFGRTASAMMRSLYAALIGLGGWCGGALLALTAFPTVPINDELLVVSAVGIPTALVVYCASPRNSVTRLVGSLLGAAGGAWLAFHASSPYVAPLLAIVGAAAGANLVVLVLDIRRDRALLRTAGAARLVSV